MTPSTPSRASRGAPTTDRRPSPASDVRAGEVLVGRDVVDPRDLAVGQDAPGQPDAGREGQPLDDIAHRADVVTLGPVQLPVQQARLGVEDPQHRQRAKPRSRATSASTAVAAASSLSAPDRIPTRRWPSPAVDAAGRGVVTWTVWAVETIEVRAGVRMVAVYTSVALSECRLRRSSARRSTAGCRPAIRGGAALRPACSTRPRCRCPESAISWRSSTGSGGVAVDRLRHDGARRGRSCIRRGVRVAPRRSRQRRRRRPARRRLTVAGARYRRR